MRDSGRNSGNRATVTATSVSRFAACGIALSTLAWLAFAGFGCVKNGTLGEGSGTGGAAGSTGDGGSTGHGGEGAFDGGPIIESDAGPIVPPCADAPCAPGVGTKLVGGSGSQHTCALLANGALECWGSNERNGLGLGTGIALSLPVVVAGAGQAATAAVGDAYTCLASASGETHCWGHRWGAPNQVDGGPDPSMPPNPWSPAGLRPARVIAGGSHQTCVIATDATVQCWGDTPDAETVPGLSGVTALGLGYRHACAVLADGGVACWGDTDQAQLGNPVLPIVAGQPARVSGVNGATALAAGGYFTCALLAGGTVRCWGDNLRGQLGADTGAQTSATPVDVQGIAGATAIAAAGFSTCAIVSGQVLCWGATLDEAGAYSSVPRVVAGVSGASAIAAGDDNMCAVVDTGAVVCWGNNVAGELGQGSAGGFFGPVAVRGWP